MTPDILFEDPDLIVCVKPAGTATQSCQMQMPDLVSMLKNHIHNNTPRKQQPYLAVIHRLDQPVEGLLVFAKTPAAAKNLSRQLTQFGFGKYYRAILTGIPDLPEDLLTDYLIKDARTNTSRICTADTPGAKKALLHYKILQSKGSYSLAELTLETGRHHQIRVQMAHLGCPIAGDRKYGGILAKEAVAGNREWTFETLQLYACRLTFQHPRTGKKLEFKLDKIQNL